MRYFLNSNTFGICKVSDVATFLKACAQLYLYKDLNLIHLQVGPFYWMRSKIKDQR